MTYGRVKCTPSGATLGPPPGTPWANIAKRLEDILGARIRSVAHRPISGWKSAGAVRLWLQLDDNVWRTLVLKRLDYTMAALPAAQILPFDISQTERIIFAHADRDQQFIARPLVILGPDDLQQSSTALVVMEDLAPAWRRPRVHHDYSLVIARLDRIHESMAQVATGHAKELPLIRYDRHLAVPLAELFERNLMAELSSLEDPGVLRLLARWPDIKEILTRLPLPEVPAAYVHGDFVPAHIFMRWLPTPRLRLIDFEWLGIGPPHADLASLLKRARPSIERIGLRLYSAQHREFSPGEHRVLYEWCQLCRGILDAVYLTLHRKLSSPPREPTVSQYARSSLGRAGLAAERLATGL